METLSVLSLCAMLAGLVHAQTAVSLFPVGFLGNDLSGEIQGTGPADTTYVLSGTTLGLPFTVTLVEGSTQLVEAAAFTAPGVTAAVSAGCAIDAAIGVAACTFVQAQGAVIQSTTALQSFLPIPITVVTSGVTISSPTTATSNSSTTDTTPSSTTTSTSDFVPPSQTIVTPVTSPVTTTTITGAPTTSSASGRGLHAAVLGMGVFASIFTSLVVCFVSGWLIAAM